jgi:hypothetical protein
VRLVSRVAPVDTTDSTAQFTCRQVFPGEVARSQDRFLQDGYSTFNLGCRFLRTEDDQGSRRYARQGSNIDQSKDAR